MLRLLILLALLVASFGCSAGAWSSNSARDEVSHGHVELASNSSTIAALVARGPLGQVRRAPVLQRLPAVVTTQAVLLATRPPPSDVVTTCTGGAGEPCLQIRRRLPRMRCDEPPWS